MSNGVRSPEDMVLMERALRWTDGFAHWPPAAMSALLERAELLRVSKGEMLTSEVHDEPRALAVVSGYIMVRRVGDDASRPALGLVGPGRMTNFSRIANSADGWHCEFVAHGPAVVIAIPSSALFDLLDSDPRLWPDMSRMLLRHLAESFNSFVDGMTGRCGNDWPRRSIDSRLSMVLPSAVVRVCACVSRRSRWPRYCTRRVSP